MSKSSTVAVETSKTGETPESLTFLWIVFHRLPHCLPQCEILDYLEGAKRSIHLQTTTVKFGTFSTDILDFPKMSPKVV